MGTKEGEIYEMNDASEEEAYKQVMDQFENRIRENKKRAVRDEVIARASDLDRACRMKAHYAFSSLSSYQFQEIYGILEDCVSAIQLIAKDLETINGKFITKVTQLEEIVQKLNSHGNDLPEVKAELKSIKSTLNSPEVAIVSQFVKDTKKRMDEYKKKMEENDLAE